MYKLIYTQTNNTDGLESRIYETDAKYNDLYHVEFWDIDANERLDQTIKTMRFDIANDYAMRFACGSEVKTTHHA